MKDPKGPRQPLTEEELRAAMVGGAEPTSGPITLAEYDEAWPGQFRREEDRIRAALGSRALLVEHVGSTSVPGLAAKPVIDILLVVKDSADEAAFVPALETALESWDTRIPTGKFNAFLAELVAELDHARRICNAVAPTTLAVCA